MRRTAVLFDAKDRKLGQTQVAETCFLIEYGGILFLRHTEGVRLAGGGIGATFRETDPAVRAKLEPSL